MDYYYFISDLYCTKTNEDAKKITAELIDLDKGVLSYNKIYKDECIHCILLINWLSNKLFGLQMSKIHLSKFASILKATDSYQRFVEVFRGHYSFLKIVAPESIAQFENEFNSYKIKLKDNLAAVKNDLYSLLVFRHTGMQTSAITDKTLFREFVLLLHNASPHDYFKNQSGEVSNDLLFDQCIITNVKLQLECDDKVESFTYIDALSWQLLENAYLLRILAKKRVIMCSKDIQPKIIENLFKKLGDPKKYSAFFITEEPILENVVHTHKLSLLKSVLPRKIVATVEYLDNDFIKNKLYLEPTVDYDESIYTSAYEDYIKGSIVWNKHIYKMYTKNINGSWNYSTKREDKAVVIIDNRANPLSAISCYITGSNLRQNEWNLVIYTSKTARPFYERLFKKHRNGLIIIDDHPRLNVDHFEIEDYNFVLKDSRIWQQLQYYGFEKILLVQDDGMIVRPGVEDFVKKYDYVGAPWHDNDILSKSCNPQKVGNGGLSIRNVNMHYEITSSESISDKLSLFNHGLQPIPEDVYFANAIYKRKGSIPSSMEASKFASEQILNMQSLGFHKFWAYNHQNMVDKYFELLAS